MVERIEVEVLSRNYNSLDEKARAKYHTVFRALNADATIAGEIFNNAFDTCKMDDPIKPWSGMLTKCKTQVENEDILKFENLQRNPAIVQVRRAKTILWRIRDTFQTSSMYKQDQKDINATICGTDTFNYQCKTCELEGELNAIFQFDHIQLRVSMTVQWYKLMRLARAKKVFSVKHYKTRKFSLIVTVGHICTLEMTSAAITFSFPNFLLVQIKSFIFTFSVSYG